MTRAHSGPILACMLVFASAAALAGPIEIGDDINARLARAKSQQGADAGARSAEARKLDGVAVIGADGKAGTAPSTGSGCNIAIGNVFEDKGRPGTNARRETTVIITGDVIQVGNNCR